MAAASQNQILRGTVKQILSGDSLIIRDRPRGGPPTEWNCGLTSIQAPRLGRRLASGEVTKDEPWAYEAREYLRRLVGKEVLFACETVVGGTGNKKYYGVLYDRAEPESERVNMNEALVREGLAEVRRTGGGGGGGGGPSGSDQLNQLSALEDQAKADGKGKWSPTEPAASHIRNVVWKVDNPRLFVDSHKQRPLNAVIEHVRDACTYRVLIALPDAYYSVSFMLSGVKSPTFKQPQQQQQQQQQQDDGDATEAAQSQQQQQPQAQPIAEPYAEEAKFFVEARLLQRNVRIVLETVSGQSVVGSVLHANGNIAEFLVQEGLARCVDWSMGVVSQPDAAVKLRQAEREAKKARRRLWKDYVETSSGGAGGIGHNNKSEKGLSAGDSIDGRVVEVGNGDSLIVKRQDTGDYVKLFLASIRPPRAGAADADGQRPKISRPLYDIPYMFEAREFLRKRLIGKRVTARVDYVQPKSPEFPEKVGATVLVGEVNVAEALVQKGLAYVIRYRADDDNRSSAYDALLAAEAVAQKKAAGVHSKKEPPAHKISDLAGDPKRAKQFLPSLQRSGRQEALVEFVASANRFRVYVPRSTCLVTLLLTGVECPRTSRRLPNGAEEPGEPFGEEASRFVKELCLQREVEILVEACDRGGNFIGHLFVDGEHLAVTLVEKGYGKVHFTAEKSDYYQALSRAEEKAKAEKLNVWSLPTSAADNNGVSADSAAAAAAATASASHRKDAAGGEDSGPLDCTVSEIRPDLTFCVQLADDSERRARLNAALREELDERRPPVPGAYTPRKGELCAARLDGNAWHRARVLRVDASGKQVQFIDLGVEKTIANIADVAQLPEALKSQAPLARICRLAFCLAPPEEEDLQQAVELLLDKVANKPGTVRRIYETDGVACVQLIEKASGVDLAELLLESGLTYIERRAPIGSKSGPGSELFNRYKAKQADAFKARLCIWRYGDFRDDDE